MALVRTAVAAKLDEDPNFHLKIHQDQMIQIKTVHPHVNAEGKKRLADFTVECSDPDFVLIMENLTLKRVLNIMAVCNPTITLEFRMDIGVSKNQIGCADPFSACYVKCNSAGRNKNQPKYITYPRDAKELNNNNTNVSVPTPVPIEIKQEKQTDQEQQAVVSKRRGRPAKPQKKPKEEIIKPIEVPPAPFQSLKSFFDQIPLDPQLSSPQPSSNNNTNEINIDNNEETIVVEQVGADVDPGESPSQNAASLTPLPIEISPSNTTNDNIEANDNVPIEESNAPAADPVNNDNSLLDQTLNEIIQQNQPEISENATKKDELIPQDVPMIETVEKNLIDQMPIEMDLATAVELTQYGTENTINDDKNNTTDDSMLNQEEMAEIFKEIFPEYYDVNNQDKVNDEYTEISNNILFSNTDAPVNVTMETLPPLPPVENSVLVAADPELQQQSMQEGESVSIPNQASTESVVEESTNQIKESEPPVEVIVSPTTTSEQVAPMEVETVAMVESLNVAENIATDTVVNNTHVTEAVVNTESSSAQNPAESWSGLAVPITNAAQQNVEIVPESNEVTRVTESVNSELPQNDTIASNDSEKEYVNVSADFLQEKEQVTVENSVEDPPREEQQNPEQSSTTIPQQIETEQQKQDAEKEGVAVEELSRGSNENNLTQSNVNNLVADEDLDLNEIVYDGEIMIESDNEGNLEPEVPFIDFFCDDALADDEREDSQNNTNVYNDNNEENNMIDDGPQVTRKRKRGFSLESVVFRSVKQKVQHVTPKQEPNVTPEKEGLQNISKDSQVSPIMRAIFTSRKNTNSNNNNASNNNTNRRITRSNAKNSDSSEISVTSVSSKKNTKRRASSQTTKVKKESQAVDSPRILIYNERGLGRRNSAPKNEKKETKAKKETKVKIDKKYSTNDEEKSKYSDEDYSSINSDEDSVEYHVDKLSEDEYFVEEILEKKVEKGKIQYLIKWLGWPHSDNTWTPEEDISPDIIEIYETSPKERNPGERNVLVYNLFWKYAFRRHVRYVKEHPEDPNYEKCKDIDVSDGLLDKFSMCNCYRELDSGSIYFKEQVARMKREEDEEDVTKQTIWMACCYRLINRLATFEGFGRIPTSRQWPRFKKYLIELRASGDSVFTSKHNVIGLENYLGVMDNLTAKIDMLHDKFVHRKKSLQKCSEYAQTLPFIGPFFAQQICNDLVEEGIIDTTNDWVCLGPGAKAGLRNIYPGIKNSDLLDKAKQLQKNQRKAFASQDFDFPFYEGRDLSLIDIEHVLCEFQKYLRMLGKKSGKRHRRTKDQKQKKARKHSTRNK